MCFFFLNQHAFTQTRSPSARSFAFTSDVKVSSWYIIYWFVCFCVWVSGIFHIRLTIFSHACVCVRVLSVYLRVCVEFIRRAPADAEEYQKGARSSVKRYTTPCTKESKTQGDIAYIQRVMHPHLRTSAMRSALLLASSYLRTHANEETQTSVTSGWFKWPTNNNAGCYSCVNLE